VICIGFVYLYFPVLFCLSVSVKWLAVKTASEMTYIVSSGALNSRLLQPIQPTKVVDHADAYRFLHCDWLQLRATSQKNEHVCFWLQLHHSRSHNCEHEIARCCMTLHGCRSGSHITVIMLTTFYSKLLGRIGANSSSHRDGMTSLLHPHCCYFFLLISRVIWEIDYHWRNWNTTIEWL